MSTKRKSNHVKRPVEKKPLGPGEARVTQIAAKDGSYVRITAEYRSLSVDGEGVSEMILNGMIGGAKMNDLRILAKQREDEIVRGELLTPDGLTVMEAWLPGDDELIMLKTRTSTLEDLATLPRYGEAEHETEQRKAEARALIAERDGPEILRQATDAVD